MHLLPAFSRLLLLSAPRTQDTYPTPSGDTDRHIDANLTVSAERLHRRNEELAAQLWERPVQGVRKMSNDEGEKFFLDYWRFEDDSPSSLLERQMHNGNSTMTDHAFDAGTEGPDGSVENDFPEAIFLARSYAFQPAFSLSRSWSGLGNPLAARDFKCPTGTNACTSIGRSDRCCGTGDRCEVVPDTGSGDVGCCSAGQTCNGGVGSCQSGYTLCSQALGGGCCIPGYACVPGGCAYISVVTVTVHSSVTTTTRTYSTAPQSTHSTSSTTRTETTDSLVPPARPTSLSTTSRATTSRVDVCPTGFYACSAVYHGGCCQTGRDCDTTSCPTTSSTTFTSNGETIVVPVTTGSSHSTGKCARGWFSCADTAGGGCCPVGFACGTSCTATAARTTVAKEQAMSGGRQSRIVGVMLGISGLCMMWMI